MCWFQSFIFQKLILHRNKMSALIEMIVFWTNKSKLVMFMDGINQFLFLCANYFHIILFHQLFQVSNFHAFQLEKKVKILWKSAHIVYMQISDVFKLSNLMVTGIKIIAINKQWKISHKNFRKKWPPNSIIKVHIGTSNYWSSIMKKHHLPIYNSGIVNIQM